MSCEPSARFRDAAAYLSSGHGPSNVSNMTKLELYGLFKYLTVSHTPSSSRPGLWDITGRPKWDAWSSAGKAYAGNAADAEQRYLDIAGELGWKDGAGEDVAAGSERTRDEPSGSKEENVWDEDFSDTTKSSGPPSGWGNKVSTVTQGQDVKEREQGTLHSLAISGDADGVKRLLLERKDAYVDDVDEYGYTPLHLACDRGHKAVVELLLGAGADSSFKDQDDFTALELARIAGHNDVVAILEKP